MTAPSQNVPSEGATLSGIDSHPSTGITSPTCPACAKSEAGAAIERYGKYELFRCAACDLHYWEPRVMPEARWYEQMYGGRDEKLLPLEPGHKYFLGDPLAPGRGELLDIGCGTGNFMAAARAAGYAVNGTWNSIGTPRSSLKKSLVCREC